MMEDAQSGNNVPSSAPLRPPREAFYAHCSLPGQPVIDREENAHHQIYPDAQF